MGYFFFFENVLNEVFNSFLGIWFWMVRWWVVFIVIVVYLFLVVDVIWYIVKVVKNV